MLDRNEIMDVVWTRISTDENYAIREIQLIITGRCADSREGSKIENKAAKVLMLEAAARGIHIMLRRVVSAGGVMNEYSIPEVIELIEHGLNDAIGLVGPERLDPHGREEKNGRIPFRTIVRLSSHGAVGPKSGKHKLVYSPEELEITDKHSPTNCGMRHAGSGVWRPFMEWFKELAPEREFFDKELRKRVKIKIRTDEDIRRMLLSLYGYNGDPKEFITDIDILEEPLKSKERLRAALDENKAQTATEVTINASVRSFLTGEDIRITNPQMPPTFLDVKGFMMKYIMDHLPNDHPEKVRRRNKQKPTVGMMCSPAVEYPRETLVAYLQKHGRRGLDVAGSVFLAVGPNLLRPFSTFGAYKLGGILYSIISLGIRNYWIVGRDEHEVRRIKEKIRNDPFLSVVFDYYKVKVHELTMSTFEKEGVRRESISAKDHVVDDLLGRALKAAKKSPVLKDSFLDRPVKFGRVLRLERTREWNGRSKQRKNGPKIRVRT